MRCKACNKVITTETRKFPPCLHLQDEDILCLTCLVAAAEYYNEYVNIEDEEETLEEYLTRVKDTD